MLNECSLYKIWHCRDGECCCWLNFLYDSMSRTAGLQSPSIATCFVLAARALASLAGGWMSLSWWMWGECTEQRHLSSVGKDWVGGEWSCLKLVGWFLGSFASLVILDREEKYSLRSWPYRIFEGDWVSLLKKAPLIPVMTWGPWIFNFQGCFLSGAVSLTGAPVCDLGHQVMEFTHIWGPEWVTAVCKQLSELMWLRLTRAEVSNPDFVVQVMFW